MSSEEAAVVAVVVVVRHGGTDFAEAEDDTHATRDLWTEVAKATRESGNVGDGHSSGARPRLGLGESR